MLWGSRKTSRLYKFVKYEKRYVLQFFVYFEKLSIHGMSDVFLLEIKKRLPNFKYKITYWYVDVEEVQTQYIKKLEVHT